MNIPVNVTLSEAKSLFHAEGYSSLLSVVQNDIMAGS